MEEQNSYDITVVGGGLHSVSMVCEAASRGLKTLLVQDGDIADGASAIPLSVAGGDLRKLEGFDFAKITSNFDELTLLRERGPHLIKPLAFHILHDNHIRSSSRINTGLLLYKRMQPKSLRMEPAVAVTTPAFEQNTRLSTYQDNLLNNSRTTIATAQLAKKQGAELKPHHRVISSSRTEKHWLLEITQKSTQKTFSVKTHIVINCCGWMANDFVETLGTTTRAKSTCVDYGHIYIRVNTPWQSGVVFQQDTGCLVYAYPFNETTVCVGPLLLPKDAIEKRQKTVENILSQWNRHLVEKISLENIIHQYWCHKAKIEDPTCNDFSHSQDSLLDLNNPGAVAPALNLFGVDTIQHRKLAEQALDILLPFTHKEKNTALIQQRLFQVKTSSINHSSLFSQFPFIEQSTLKRLINHYGPDTERILDRVTNKEDLGYHFGHGLYEAEVRYLMANEWAVDSEDLLWRRTYLGTEFTTAEIHALDAWLTSQNSPIN